MHISVAVICQQILDSQGSSNKWNSFEVVFAPRVSREARKFDIFLKKEKKSNQNFSEYLKTLWCILHRHTAEIAFILYWAFTSKFNPYCCGKYFIIRGVQQHKALHIYLLSIVSISQYIFKKVNAYTQRTNKGKYLTHLMRMLFICSRISEMTFISDYYSKGV